MLAKEVLPRSMSYEELLKLRYREIDVLYNILPSWGLFGNVLIISLPIVQFVQQMLLASKPILKVRIFKFLAGLNLELDQVRSRILGMDLLPTPREAFANV